MMGLPEGYATRPPSREDAEEVVALIVACQLADTGASDVSLDELIDDWHDLDLDEEAIVVAAPDGRIAGYADVLNRSFAMVSVYGHVHPDHRERGIGAFLVARGRTSAPPMRPSRPPSGTCGGILSTPSSASCGRRRKRASPPRSGSWR